MNGNGLPEGARTVARLLHGMPVDEPSIARLEEPWKDAAAQLALVRQDDRQDLLSRIILGLPEPSRVLSEVMGAREEIRLRLGESLGTCPPLPSHVHIISAQDAGCGKWLDTYVQYAQAVSPMTPKLFHESAGLWLGSTIIARRLVVHMPFGEIFPNLFITWVAETTLFSKTTALDVAKGIARRVFPHLLAAQDTTPEALLSDMAGEEPANLDKMPEALRARWEAGRNFAAQRGWVLDEMSGLMAGAGKDYNAGLLETLLRCYDCDVEFTRSTRTQGRVVVRNAHLSLLGASTPAALAHHLVQERPWAMGWWPRFALLVPDTERPPWQVAAGAEEPLALEEALRSLDGRLPTSPWPDPPIALSVPLMGGVSEMFEGYSKAVRYDLLTDDLDRRLFGTYGRLPVQALKVAIILAALEWAGVMDGLPRIELRHLNRAIEIVESWRASAHRALVLASSTNYDKMRRRLLQVVVRSEPRGATYRELCKAMRDKEPEEIQDALRQMTASGEMRCVDGEPGPKGGRPTDRYRVGRG